MDTQLQGPDHWYQSGIAFDDRGQCQDAIASYSKAIALKADYYEAWVRRGLALMLLKDFQPAIANFNQAVALKMDLDLAWYLKAYCHAQTQADDFALLALQKAVTLNPSQWIAMAGRDPAFDNLRGDPRFQALIAV